MKYSFMKKGSNIFLLIQPLQLTNHHHIDIQIQIICPIFSVLFYTPSITIHHVLFFLFL